MSPFMIKLKRLVSQKSAFDFITSTSLVLVALSVGIPVYKALFVPRIEVAKTNNARSQLEAFFENYKTIDTKALPSGTAKKLAVELSATTEELESLAIIAVPQRVAVRELFENKNFYEFKSISPMEYVPTLELLDKRNLVHLSPELATELEREVKFPLSTFHFIRIEKANLPKIANLGKTVADEKPIDVNQGSKDKNTLIPRAPLLLFNFILFCMLVIGSTFYHLWNDAFGTPRSYSKLQWGFFLLLLFFLSTAQVTLEMYVPIPDPNLIFASVAGGVGSYGTFMRL